MGGGGNCLRGRGQKLQEVQLQQLQGVFKPSCTGVFVGCFVLGCMARVLWYKDCVVREDLSGAPSWLQLHAPLNKCTASGLCQCLHLLGCVSGHIHIAGCVHKTL